MNNEGVRVIVLSRELLGFDERAFCRNLLHELIHVAGFDEDVAGELTDALSERYPEIFGPGDEAVKAVNSIMKKNTLTCISVEKTVEKNSEIITKLKRYAITLRDLVKCES